MDDRSPVNVQLRQLPAVDKLVEKASIGGEWQRWSLLVAARERLADLRAQLRQETGSTVVDLERLVAEVREAATRLELAFPRRVLNATGVVLHTNLGRAPLARRALEEISDAAAGYSDLELDLDSGRRGSRGAPISALLRALSGAEDALVVNNAAAGLLLTVDTLAPEREVVLSRGELVEIGGSFRVPEIMGASRARLREVGTTNRTHPEDYERAIGPETGLLLKVHRSNFRVEGFTAEVGLAQLARIAQRAGLPLIEDRGSGTFMDLRPHGIPELEAWAGLREGADVVIFSGDKLLGGPQAGIILGRGELVERMRRSPLARALRVDKLTLSGLGWTLRALLEGREREVPVLRMLLAPAEELAVRAERIAAGLRALGWSQAEVRSGRTPVGGGSLPDVELPSSVVHVPLDERAAGELAAALRRGQPPVLVRVQRGVVHVDPRTLEDADVDTLLGAFRDLHAR
jgi:L-seryl-tRNA(Ser) seleniumtransferase